jgi:uncharacterized Zn finger protein
LTLWQVWFRVWQGVFHSGFTAKGFHMNWGRYEFAPYVPVAQKLCKAAKLAAQRAKKEQRDVSPVKLQGKAIAKTFWGKAWCDNLTAYQDFSNRLPRGATYVRNGSVVDLLIKPKKIEAIVAGSEPYHVKIEITSLDAARWNFIRSQCSESIDSLLDLLSGKLSDGVMKRLTDRKTGLFPSPREIKMSCSCPDYSSCCKHLAAVMYGVGARLDSMPELLFLLRGVDHQELVSQAIAAGNLDRELSVVDDNGLGTQDLSELFGIELNSGASAATVSDKKKPAAKKKLEATKTSSQKKVVEPAGRIDKSIKQQKPARKRASQKGSAEPATSSQARKSIPGKLSRKKADSETSPSRKTSAAKASSAGTTKKERTATKMAATAAAIMKTVAKQKSAARQVRRSSKVD